MHAEHNINMCHTDKTCKLQIYRKHLTPFFWNLSEANHAPSVDWGLAPCGAPWPHKSSHRYTWRESRHARVMIAKKYAYTTRTVFKVHNLRCTLNQTQTKSKGSVFTLYICTMYIDLPMMVWNEPCQQSLSCRRLCWKHFRVWIFAVLYWELGIYCASQSSNRQG